MIRKPSEIDIASSLDRRSIVTITVRPIDFGDDSRPFVDVLWNIYKDDQSWIPTLHSLQLDQIKPDYNPFIR